MSESVLDRSFLRHDDLPARRVVTLDDPQATLVELVGVKAANLARSKSVGLPVLDGFVVTTVATRSLVLPVSATTADPIRAAWEHLSGSGRHALAVRSSSVGEDTADSSMAGRFLSVLHVSGWPDFVAAVHRVIASAQGPAAVSDQGVAAPMAVLVQRMADARVGGVLFGLDPLTGDRHQFLASVAEGLPEQIVSGAVAGTTVVLGRHGHVRSADGPVPDGLDRCGAHRLARLARRAARVFGSPQDIEWLIEPDGTLRLLQSRPITASAVPAPKSHRLGPGPVAESFPGALSPLEQDLWIAPLEDGLREALRLSGTVSRKTLREHIVVNVHGRVAVDLDALGALPVRRTVLRILDPRPGYRRLRAAWRVGRLRGALPAIVDDLVVSTDRALAELPAVEQLREHELLTVLDNARASLVGLHVHEVLAGLFMDKDASAATGSSVALATLARARADGLTDEQIIAEYPVTLSLLPPRIQARHVLPATPAEVRPPQDADNDPMLLARESARLRIRWVQELGVRAALELGRRLSERGQLRSAEQVRGLDRAQLIELVGSPHVAAHTVMEDTEDDLPLPAVFRLAQDGTLVAEPDPDGAEARGVSAGRGTGIVTHDLSTARGAVLVVPSLDPGLAPILPDVVALVSETGSPLSHLAILAREYRVPVVVGYRNPLPDGEIVTVDGGTGSVELAAVETEQ